MSRYARDTIHAIILAGGRSSRMGFDKARLEINGETLLDRLVRLLSPLFNGILISASSNTSLTNNALRHVIDEQPDRGPLMAIYSCLKASPSNINFVIACDIPLVDHPNDNCFRLIDGQCITVKNVAIRRSSKSNYLA